MVSTNHPNSKYYFDRDVKCINDLFRRKFNFKSERIVKLEDCKLVMNLDNCIKASGFSKDKIYKDIKMID